MSISYLSMTKLKCINMGRSFWKTEQWNAYAHIRQDLFGFADAITLGDTFMGDDKERTKEMNSIIAIQCTGPGGIPEHKRKILANEYAKRWLECGGTIEIWGFSKRRSMDILKNGKRSRRKVWTARIEHITLADFT